MIRSEWILDVCKDLQLYAQQNFLEGVAEALDLTMQIAQREIGQRDDLHTNEGLSATITTEDAVHENVIPLANYRSR